MIPFKLAIALAVCAVSSFYAYHAGNQYGSYARAYREVVAELKEKNRAIEDQKAEDQKEISALEEKLKTAAKGAADLKTCKVTKDQAKKINAVRE